MLHDVLLTMDKLYYFLPEKRNVFTPSPPYEVRLNLHEDEISLEVVKVRSSYWPEHHKA